MLPSLGVLVGGQAHRDPCVLVHSLSPRFGIDNTSFVTLTRASKFTEKVHVYIYIHTYIYIYMSYIERYRDIEIYM